SIGHIIIRVIAAFIYMYAIGFMISRRPPYFNLNLAAGSRVPAPSPPPLPRPRARRMANTRRCGSSSEYLIKISKYLINLLF
ncbi:MAG: hypothetical protein LBL83_10620, partial [Clostridiales bacterium]|nr:hypothetical protein [Clostridiales bacterium]